MYLRLMTLCLMLAAHGASAAQVTVVGPVSQKLWEMELSESENLESQLEEAVLQAEDCFASAEESAFFFGEERGQRVLKGRDYWVQPNEEDVENIHYIISTLANTHLLKLYGLKGKIKEAGDRIEYLHPLRFMAVVFSEESLKVGMNNLRHTYIQWANLIEGIEESFQREYEAENMWSDYVEDFAAQLELDSKDFRHLIDQGRWSDFILWLIDHLPREGDPDCYDF